MTDAAVTRDPYAQPIPVTALIISVLALIVSVTGSVFFNETLAEYGFLLWLLAIIPAFLLCYYRGWTRIMIVLGTAMTLISIAYAVSISLGWQLIDWPVFVFIVATYIGLALGWGWFTEVKAVAEERQDVQQELRLIHAHLMKSQADLKLAQWKLIEAEKLEAVGQLAAGVAHEVKNPLMTILTGTRYLSEHLEIKDEDVRLLLTDMLYAVERANSVITGLLDFSAPRELKLAPNDLNKLANQSAKMVKHELDKAHVSISVELAENIPELRLDAFKIQQVLVNVLTNAAHATPKGGKISIQTYVSNTSLLDIGDGADIPPSGRDMVILEVNDTGSGIPAEQLKKLYDPFFATKPTGKGTGLGLSVTRQIVDMHGGKIDIRNRDEGGVKVTIGFVVPEEDKNGGEEARSAG